MRFGLLSLGVAMTITLGAFPAGAQWSAAYKADFLRQCVSGCEQNPNVPPDKRLRCTAFCNCYISEGEQVSSDSNALERELASGQDTPTVRRFKAIGPTCNQRVFQ